MKLLLVRARLFFLCCGALGPLAWCQSPSTYVRTQAGEAQIDVFADRPASYTIPRTVYGTFLEDIGHSVFGGVSAEIIDNPSFEAYDASLETLKERFSASEFERSTRMGMPLPWLPLRDQGVRYEPRWGHAANSNRYLFLMGLADKEVGVRQMVYLPIERERVYNGSLFAASAGDPVKLGVSFRRHNFADAVLTSAEINLPGNSSDAGSDPAWPAWHRYDFKLTLPERALAPLEPVDFAVSINGDERVSIDEILLYPADAIDGLDPEVIRVAKDLHSPLLRFGGNFTSGYHWRDGIGPVESRPTQLNQSWGFPEYNLFGTDELMKFCGLIGAQPQICLNLGSGTPQEARDWVEYCQGAANTPLGKLRAANGHPEPYPVAAWELGNELWGTFQIGWQTPQLYPDRYRTFYEAIRGLVPQNTMIFANGADLDEFHEWNGALIDKDAGILSYLTTHFVVGMEEMVAKQAGRDAAWAADFAIPVGVARALEPVKAQIDANPAARGKVKLAYTEWLFWAPEGSEYPRWDNLGGAVLGAGWMNMLLSHADFVPVSDMTGLLEFAGIYKKRGRVFVTPQYWALWLYSNFAGDTPVETRTEVSEYDVHGGERRVPEISNVPDLDVLATTDTHSASLTLFVVNRDWRKSIPATIRIEDFAPGSQATVRTLNADSILTGNDEEHPDRVHPVETSLRLTGSSFRYAFPAHSVTAISFGGRAAAAHD
ncbi:MAG TPA: alpha-L-arabinofuranosidase C-terminal domain-containing protein [Terriglobia bacterium]|nr:alpha-L-arabinofuranosidase C-terminal domain-containing protein [Terriglobia bacterium]